MEVVEWYFAVWHIIHNFA